MGEMYPPTAADYAQASAHNADMKAQGLERRLEMASKRIASLEQRVETLELNLRVVLARTAPVNLNEMVAQVIPGDPDAAADTPTKAAAEAEMLPPT